MAEIVKEFKKVQIEAKKLAGMDPFVEWELEQSMKFIEGLELLEDQVQALEDSLDPVQAQLRGFAEAYISKALGRPRSDSSQFTRPAS